MKHGTIPDDLEKEFDNTFISYLMNCKKKNIPWYEECTYTELKASQDKMKKKLDNPLVIDDSKIEVYSNSILEYPFVLNEQFFIRDDGDTKAKKRKKNIIVYFQKENFSIN